MKKRVTKCGGGCSLMKKGRTNLFSYVFMFSFTLHEFWLGLAFGSFFPLLQDAGVLTGKFACEETPKP